MIIMILSVEDRVCVKACLNLTLISNAEQEEVLIFIPDAEI